MGRIALAETTESGLDKRPSAPASMMRPLLVVFLPFACGYFLSYLYRSVNAVIAPQLIGDIGLSAGNLGFLTAIYLLAFAAFQLPLGLLLDRYGPRRVQAALLLVAALGALIFAIGQSMLVLTLGRALIGLGVAGGLMASFKAITLWFPPARWPLINGCFLASGGLGALAATVPVETLLQVTDWRGVFFILCAATVCASGLIFKVVPEAESGVEATRFADQMAGLRMIYTDRVFWRLAPVTITCSAAGMSILGLWAGPWFKDVAGFDRAGVATSLLISAAAMAAGSVFAGVAADLFGRRGISLNLVMGSGVAVYGLALAAIVFGLDLPVLLPWIVFGLTANMNMLVFPQLSAHFPLHYAGRASTALNVLVFIGAFSCQYAIGWIIDFWTPAPGGGYQAEAYQVAFGAVLALVLLAFVWFLLGSGARNAARPMPAA